VERIPELRQPNNALLSRPGDLFGRLSGEIFVVIEAAKA
jgi:hypothetical protein